MTIGTTEAVLAFKISRPLLSDGWKNFAAQVFTL